MPYSLPQPSTLDDIFKMNPGAFMQGQQFMGGGVQQNEADLKKAQLANLFDEQNDPLRVQEQQLANQQRQFQLPGMQADSSMRVRKNANEAELNDETMKAARTAFAQKATQAHLDELEAKGQEMAYSSDPAIAAQGQKILMAHKDIVRDKAKQEEMQARQVALETVRGKNAIDLADRNNSAGRYSPKGSGKNRDPVLAIMLENDPVKKYTGLLGLAKQAEQAGDEEAQAGFLEQAKAIEAVAQAKLQAAGTPAYTIGADGKISASPRSSNVPLNTPQITTQRAAAKEQAQADLASGAQFSSPEVEARVRQFAGPAKAGFSPQAEDWIVRAMKANPGMTREAVIEQGKKKGKF
jgi:hypothetical protein